MFMPTNAHIGRVSRRRVHRKTMPINKDFFFSLIFYGGWKKSYEGQKHTRVEKPFYGEEKNLTKVDWTHSFKRRKNIMIEVLSRVSWIRLFYKG